jgi:hypothetical protein
MFVECRSRPFPARHKRVACTRGCGSRHARRYTAAAPQQCCWPQPRQLCRRRGRHPTRKGCHSASVRRGPHAPPGMCPAPPPDRTPGVQIPSHWSLCMAHVCNTCLVCVFGQRPMDENSSAVHTSSPTPSPPPTPPASVAVCPGHVPVHPLHWSQSNRPRSQTSWSTAQQAQTLFQPPTPFLVLRIPHGCTHWLARTTIPPKLLCLAAVCMSPSPRGVGPQQPAGALAPCQPHPNCVALLPKQ